MNWREVNPMALLTLLAAVILAVLGDIPAEAALTLMAGLAIPARSTGYQNEGDS